MIIQRHDMVPIFFRDLTEVLIKLFTEYCHHPGKTSVYSNITVTDFLTQVPGIMMNLSLIARFMGPTWGPSGADRTQVGPMLAPWTLLSGITCACSFVIWNDPVHCVYQIWYFCHIINLKCESIFHQYYKIHLSILAAKFVLTVSPGLCWKLHIVVIWFLVSRSIAYEMAALMQCANLVSVTFKIGKQIKIALTFK